MTDQTPEQVDRYPGDPAQPSGGDVPRPPIEEKTGQDQGVTEDLAQAALGAPAQDVRHTATGEDAEDRPQQ